jgi:hypothetical protein
LLLRYTGKKKKNCYEALRHAAICVFKVFEYAEMALLALLSALQTYADVC